MLQRLRERVGLRKLPVPSITIFLLAANSGLDRGIDVPLLGGAEIGVALDSPFLRFRKERALEQRIVALLSLGPGPHHRSQPLSPEEELAIAIEPRFQPAPMSEE